jgi:choline/glycine/proline betaine transport protein
LPSIGVGGWLQSIDAEGNRSSATTGIIVALIIIMGGSTISALSGVGKGIKWLSNINMVLSFFVLTFFLIFGSTFFGLNSLFIEVWDYLASIPGNIFTVWTKDGTETGDALASWQGASTVFYWAWWIAFAPFVGVFLARISKGRTIREYILGAMVIPAVMYFVWFALVGGTAIDLELTGVAEGAIASAGQADQLFVMLGVMLGENAAYLMSLVVVVLLLTYLITSADSAVLIINTINAGGDEGPKARPHILFWGAAKSIVVRGLIIAGGLSAIKTAMVIGALPFSLVMVLMGISLIVAIYGDLQREKHGLQTIYAEEAVTV